MRVANVQVFKFEELTEAAKERARNWYREGLDFVVDDLTDWFKTFLEEKGYEADNVWWSLGYCQGDGVCFEGSVDVLKVARRILNADELHQVERLARATDFYAKVTCTSRSYTTRLDYLETDANWRYPRIEKLVERLAEAVQDDIDDMCHQMKKDGYAEFEYQYSDEVVDESIIANEYEFDEDGDLFR